MSRDGGTGSRHWSTRDDADLSSKELSRSTSRKHSEDNAQATQDMDISPGDSTPTSEVSYGHSGGVQPLAVDQNSHGPVLLANALPRLISHPIHLPSTPTTARPEMSPLANPQSTPSMLPAALSITTANTPGPPVTHLASASAEVNDPKIQTMHSTLIMNRQVVAGDNSVHTQLLTVDTNSGPVNEGPPTPTHSETPDCAKGKLT